MAAIRARVGEALARHMDGLPGVGARLQAEPEHAGRLVVTDLAVVRMGAERVQGRLPAGPGNEEADAVLRVPLPARKPGRS